MFLACVGIPAGATILQQLTLDEMAQKSTSIVRARVTGSHAVVRTGDVFTVYTLATLESLKPGRGTREVAVPGGVTGGIRQVVAGAPLLRAGQEYVLFLWTRGSGLTQVIGMSQGLFRVEKTTSGDRRVSRGATGEQMLDAAGRTVRDEALSMSLPELKAKVFKALATAANAVPPASLAVRAGK
ncbi:MAG: hypothetical protein ABI833_06845 [Acidobacteriota bacterium]